MGGDYLDPVLTRYSDTIVYHTKCSGYELVALPCVRRLQGYFPTSFGRWCRYLPETGDMRGTAQEP